METKANHLAVGAFVLVAIAGFFAFVMWLGKTEIDREVDAYHIYFHGSVSGLTTSSTVRYRGVPVGSVTDPAFAEKVVKTAVDRLGTLDIIVNNAGYTYDGVIHKRVSPTELEKLHFDGIHLDGVVLDHKRVVTFSAPRGKRG